MLKTQTAPTDAPPFDPTADGHPSFDPSNADGPGLDAQMAALYAGQGPGAAGDLNLEDYDLSKVRDEGFAVLTDGETYDFEITMVKPGLSAAGNKKIFMVLEVTEDYAEAGQRIPDNITLTEAALWRLKSLGKALDMLSSEGKFLGTAQSLKGKRVRGKIKNEEYNGRMGSKIDGGFMPASGSSLPQAEGGSALPPGF